MRSTILHSLLLLLRLRNPRSLRRFRQLDDTVHAHSGGQDARKTTERAIEAVIVMVMAVLAADNAVL